MANQVVYISINESNKIVTYSNARQSESDIEIDYDKLNSFDIKLGDLYYENELIIQKPKAPDIIYSPSVLSMTQCRLALLHFGFLNSVISFIDSIPGEEGMRAKIHWDSQRNVQKSHPLVMAIQSHFGWTNEFIDQMFEYGFTQ